MRDNKVTISYLTTVLRIPENVCKLDDFFLIQTLASFDLESVVLKVTHTYIHFLHTLFTDVHTNN